MKFCDKLYVGFQRDRYNNADTPRVLGFAVPHGITKAEQSRMATVDHWANKKEDCRIIENKPTRGFKMLEVVSRYSTSNKLFRVLDPRGFELEISADNLLDLAMATTIVRGEIVEECIWAQHNGVYLMPTSSEQYKFWTGAKTKPKEKIEAGKYYVSVGNLLSVFRFEGIYHHTYMSYKHHATSAERKSGVLSGYSRTHDEMHVTSYDTNVVINMNSGNKPSYIYTEFILNDDGNLERKQIHARKSHFKGLNAYDDSNLPKSIIEYVPNLTQWTTTDGYWNYGDNLDRLIMSGNGFGFDGFFKTKDEAKDFDYSEIIKKISAKNEGYRNRVDTSVVEGRTGYYYGSYYTTIISPHVVQKFNIDDQR